MNSATFAFANGDHRPRRTLRRALSRPVAQTAEAPIVANQGDNKRIAEANLAGSTHSPHYQALLLGLGVFIIHVLVFYAIKVRPAPPVPVLTSQPVAVELTTPPAPVEPPKPLPQKKLLTPPPPTPVATTPHIDTPPPDPTPLPAPAPSTPVVQAPPPPPPPQPVATPVAEPMTPAVGYAGYLNNPQPEYPQFAIDQGWEGRVLLAVHVLASGHAEHVDVKRSSGHKLLDEIASRTVLQHWLFLPAKRGQAAVDGWVDVPIDYKLSI